MLTAPLLLAAGGLVLVLAGLRTALHRGLTPPARPQGTPAAWGLAGRAVRIPTPRGGLFAWHAPVPGPGPHPAAVLLHGWGGQADDLVPAASHLQARGFTVLLLEARNHGRSDRDGHSSLPRFAEDLEQALDWLRCQPGVDPRRLSALGHSVGAAAVLLVASRRHDLAAVVGVGGFAHPEWVMRRWLAARRIPYRPFGWLVNRYVERVIGARFDDIAPVRRIARVRCPVLLLHGRHDTTVPPADALALVAAGGTADVRCLQWAGDHEHFEDLPAVMEEVRGFLQAAAPLPEVAPTR